MKAPDVVEIKQKCPKCGIIHKIYANFLPDPKIDANFEKKGFAPFPKDAKIICECGFEIDLLGLKTQIEVSTRRKIIVKERRDSRGGKEEIKAKRK